MLDLSESIQGLLLGSGYLALFAIVFAESGLFFGFFLPGDSLLFTAGILAATGFFDLKIVLLGVAICAIAGDQVGYWTGANFGKKLFNKPGSFFFDPKHIEEAQGFYEKHGKKTIVLARFVPAIRTFAPIVAGIGGMDYKTFVTYNIAGGILWTLIFVLGGYFLGSLLPNAGEMLTLVIIGIIVLSIVPLAYEILKRRAARK
ncbi:MAG TPA: VTT domain-containing protein [archaeon]|nr:VTT domain-containing protein [archaeon]